MSAVGRIEYDIRQPPERVKSAGPVCKRIAEMNGGPGEKVETAAWLHMIVAGARCVILDHDVAARHPDIAVSPKIDAAEVWK